MTLAKLDPKVIAIKQKFILNSAGPWTEADVRALIGQIDLLTTAARVGDQKPYGICRGCGCGIGMIFVQENDGFCPECC